MARLANLLLPALQNLLAPDLVAGADSDGALPAWPGAYVLAIRLDEPVAFERGKARKVIGPGWYAYCGSAYGPGGVGARIRRHFRREKEIHWHVDRLTLAAARIEALALRDDNECALVARLVASGDFRAPLPGFGSSDCRACSSHLLTWRDRRF